jgi:Tat protein translocase TatB subunit
VLNIGPAELLMILVVALLVLGPTKLPEAARQLGKAMSEFRRVTSGLQDEVKGVLDEHFEVADAPKPLDERKDTSDGDGAPPEVGLPPVLPE